MKKYLEEQDCFIEFVNLPIGDTDSLKDGELCDHKSTSNRVIFFLPESEYGGCDKFTKVSITADRLIEIANQVNELNNTKTKLPYSSLPF